MPTRLKTPRIRSTLPPARLYLQGSDSYLMTVEVGGFPEVRRHDVLFLLSRHGEPFSLQRGDTTSPSEAAALAPLVRHGVRSTGGFALVSVHLWHPLYKALLRVTTDPVNALSRADFSSFDARLESAIAGQLDANSATDLVEELLARVLEGQPEVPPLDARVFEAMCILDNDVQTPFDAVASRLGVSHSRLSHLFSQELGVSFRGFVAWLRLRTAWEFIVLQPTKPLGDIAHELGFSDAGHLSRSFRESFGITPTTMREPHREIIGYPMPRGWRARASRGRKGHNVAPGEDLSR